MTISGSGRRSSTMFAQQTKHRNVAFSTLPKVLLTHRESIVHSYDIQLRLVVFVGKHQKSSIYFSSMPTSRLKGAEAPS